MARWFGITGARCLLCGYSTTDRETLDVWNDMAVTCPDCDAWHGRVLWRFEGETGATFTVSELSITGDLSTFHHALPTRYQRIWDYVSPFTQDAFALDDGHGWDRLSAIAGEFDRGEITGAQAKASCDETTAEVIALAAASDKYWSVKS